MATSRFSLRCAAWFFAGCALLWAECPAQQREYAFTYASARARVADWVETYPDLVTERSIGQSVEGRDIPVLRISSTDDPDAPEMYLGSGIHGIEGSETDGLWMVDRLLARSHEPPIQELLASRVLWFQPFVNPDGIAARTRLNAHGTDLNRNFGHLWLPQGEPGSNSYSGPEPFSEPETRAVRDFLRERENLRVSLDLHRSARLVFVAEIARAGRVAPSSLVAYRGLIEAMGPPFDQRTKPLRFDQGGFSADWVQGALGVLAFTWELPYDNDLAARDDARWRGLLHLLQRCGEYERQARPARVTRRKRIVVKADQHTAPLTARTPARC